MILLQSCPWDETKLELPFPEDVPNAPIIEEPLVVHNILEIEKTEADEDEDCCFSRQCNLVLLSLYTFLCLNGSPFLVLPVLHVFMQQ